MKRGRPKANLDERKSIQVNIRFAGSAHGELKRKWLKWIPTRKKASSVNDVSISEFIRFCVKEMRV